jgi:hypothetical protein
MFVVGETAKVPGTGSYGSSLSPKQNWRSPAMATERNPNSSYNPDRLNDPTRTYIDDRRSPAEFDNEMQPDPELSEGPASNARIAMIALGIAIVLGAVFYGLNRSSVQQASTAPTPTAQNTAPTSPPATPPGMRDVTPRNNSASGVTTGAAPAQNPPNPAAPPANSK